MADPKKKCRKDQDWCDVCDRGFSKRQRCAHLRYAQQRYEIQQKKDRDAEFRLHPSSDPILYYIEQRHLLLPDDHDCQMLMQCYILHKLNPWIIERLIREIDQQLFDSDGKIASFPGAWHALRTAVTCERLKIISPSKFQLNNTLEPWFTRLVQITRPGYLGKWKTRKTKRRVTAHADHELGWVRAEPPEEQDERP
jgi:hypothetical protein